MVNASTQLLTLRPSEERGFADHECASETAQNNHTFSFASYHDQKHQQWGPLRVINEDRVEPTRGFGTHGHREFEIFSIILEGELEHRDSLGGLETMGYGDVQLTSTGTGVRHSEYNRHPSQGVHFLQIWAQPNMSGLPPSYYHRHFPVEAKRDVLLRIVAPVGSSGVKDVREDENGVSPTPIHADMTVYTSRLWSGRSVSRKVGADVKRGYVHLATHGYRPPNESAPASGPALTVTCGGSQQTLKEGDGLYIDAQNLAGGEICFTNRGADAEFVYFEMAA